MLENVFSFGVPKAATLRSRGCLPGDCRPTAQPQIDYWSLLRGRLPVDNSSITFSTTGHSVTRAKDASGKGRMRRGKALSVGSAWSLSGNVHVVGVRWVPPLLKMKAFHRKG